MASVFTSQADGEASIGAARFAALCADDGGHVANPAIVDKYLAKADSWVRTFLEGQGYTKSQLELVASNETLRGAATDILIGLLGERKVEWRNELGKGQHDVELKRGQEMLKMLVKGPLRISEAGRRTNLGGSVSAPDPVYTVASSASNRKGPGGF